MFIRRPRLLPRVVLRAPRLRGRAGPVRVSVGLGGASVSACCVGYSPCLTAVVAVAVLLLALAGGGTGRR